MFRLVYSNRTEELLAELATRARTQQREAPLVPVNIVVPSASVERYLRLGVARVSGIAANLDVARLTRFVSELLASSSGVRVADAASLEAMSLALLLDDHFLSHDDLVPVKAYLYAGGDAAGVVDVRRVQLAARVGRLLEEYTYSRGDMLAAWVRGTTLDPAYAETEGWQRRFYLAMFGDDGLASSWAGTGGTRLLPLHDAVAGLDLDEHRPIPSVHVFGFAHVARTFHELFERLSRKGDVVVYALSPCEGFWEDVDVRDPAPLHLWGRPGREHVRALNLASRFDHDDRFVDPAEDGGALHAPTLLHRLQSDILRRERERPRPGPAGAYDQDESIVVLEHAGIRRELEAVASEIWRLLGEDQTLHFDDIALIVPESDAQSYAVHVPAVFHEAFDLPHRMVGLPVAGGGHVAEAIDLLLALPCGRFTRQELLRLALHPMVVTSLEDVDPSSWLAWCDALGIVHGADRSDHDGTYIGRDILNWDQGLRRLALGSFMAGDASGDKTPFELRGDAYLPHEVPPSQMRDAAGFGVLVRSLTADARFASGASMTMPEWARWIETLVETYVAPSDDAAEEDLARCLRRLHRLAAVDLGGRRVGYGVARELARGRVSATREARGGEGVVVSTVQAARPLPFRVVFACGMGEGRFPSPETDDPLDLRWARRREGDITARERDRYSFLELLLGARDRLYASYVSRDAVTGDALSPSTVVQELIHTLARAYARDGHTLRRRHPLRRWDARYFPELFPGVAATPLGTMHLPEARAEAKALAMRQHLERVGARIGKGDLQRRARTDPAWAAVAGRLGFARLPDGGAATEGRIVVPMYALVKFLEFPLQGWARFRVGLDEQEDEDAMALEDEPFETPRRDETLFLRSVLLEARGRSLEEAYDAVVRDRELRGRGPSGVFAQGERESHLATLVTWKRELAACDIPVDSIEVHRFGPAGEHARADEVHDAVVVDVGVEDAQGVLRIVRAEIGGRTLPLGPGAATSVIPLKRGQDVSSDDWARADEDRASLRAFVDHAVLSASGVAEGRDHACVAVVATPDGALTRRRVFGALSGDEARGWLRVIVGELLGGPHAYFLPCEAVFVHRHKAPAGSVTPFIDDARAKLADSDGPPALRSAYGPVPRPHEHPSPAEDDARAMIERRFGAFFDRLEDAP
jgi:exodeoxyribonuclease V gamma subunit